MAVIGREQAERPVPQVVVAEGDRSALDRRPVLHVRVSKVVKIIAISEGKFAGSITFSQTVSSSCSGLALAMHLSSVTESPLVSVTDSSGGTTISGATSMPSLPPPVSTSRRVYGEVSSWPSCVFVARALGI